MASLSHEHAAKLLDLLDGLPTTMLTTIHEGRMHSRPMATQKNDPDGTLWFLTSKDSEKAHELTSNSAVNLSYCYEGKARYVSVSGTAELVDDLAKKQELWSEAVSVWFTGPEDPNLVLLKVDVDGVEYWDTPGGKMVSLFGWIKSLITKTDDSLGENESFSA